MAVKKELVIAGDNGSYLKNVEDEDQWVLVVLNSDKQIAPCSEGIGVFRSQAEVDAHLETLSDSCPDETFDVVRAKYIPAKLVFADKDMEKAMERTTMKIEVLVTVEHENRHTPQDVMDEVQAEMDYRMVYCENGMRICDTEILGAEELIP